MKRAAVLWSGGKDSTMALLAVRDTVHVDRLVTFVPDPPKPFLAHPLEVLRAQAAALGLTHEAVPVAAPAAASYERAIEELAAGGVEVLVTGDMDRVDGHENWILERARGRVEVARPLWECDRVEALERLLAAGVEAVCTLARRDVFAPTIVGRRLDERLVAELAERHGRDGFDACGENGEYHTCVLHAPGFRTRLRLEGARVERRDDFDHLAFEAVAGA